MGNWLSNRQNLPTSFTRRIFQDTRIREAHSEPSQTSKTKSKLLTVKYFRK